MSYHHNINVHNNLYKNKESKGFVNNSVLVLNGKKSFSHSNPFLSTYLDITVIDFEICNI